MHNTCVHAPWPVMISGDVCELAELCLRQDDDESLFEVDMSLLSEPDSRRELLRKRQ